MKVVIAMDSFKGSLTSLEAGNAAREGVLRAQAQAQVCVRPLADGGEGTVEALISGFDGQPRTISVCGPLGAQVDCTYGLLPQSSTAVIEMASAAGLTLVPRALRDPMRTSTYGVGQVIIDAIEQGMRHFIVGIGGSATNDGGAGMLQALGFGLMDEEGAPIPRGAAGLERLARITDDQVHPKLSCCTFSIACDVTNPLCGPNGASAIFGPQKGADAQSIALMDGWLDSYAQLAADTFPAANATAPGTGAAGGLGFAFLTFTNAVLKSGIHIVLEETRLADHLTDVDLVITGEGRLDGQTAMGKAPAGVAALAKSRGIMVVALAGSVAPDADGCNDAGIDAFFPIVRGVTSLEDAMQTARAYDNMSRTAEQVMRLICAAQAQSK